MKFLEKNLVAIDVDVSTPEEAIRAAGLLLQNEGFVEESYITAMVESYHKNGPYFVLAPQIALPHARPEDGVKEASVSFIRLKRPIKFGNKANDPVQLVFALGASSNGDHLHILQKITQLLSYEENLEKLKTATTYEDIQKLIGG